MIKIKDLKRDQFFWYAPPQWEGEKELLRVWGTPEVIGNTWCVEATCGGDYSWDLNEGHEEWLFQDEHFK